MVKKKLTQMSLFLSLFILLIALVGCEVNQTKSSSGSGSGSGGTTTQEQPAHGQATYNILERSPFKGQQLDSAFWSNLEAYCKAGPTELLISDMLLIPSQMSRAGFEARENAQYYALSRTVAGADWKPGDDGELQFLKDHEGEMDAWWSRYIQAIVQIMQKAPQTTAIIIVNDGPDRLGRSLGAGTYRQMSPVINRVSMGDTVPD
jgi:hypothetical protein